MCTHTGGICVNPGCTELPGRDERINLLAVRSHAAEEEACVAQHNAAQKTLQMCYFFWLKTGGIMSLNSHCSHKEHYIIIVILCQQRKEFQGERKNVLLFEPVRATVRRFVIRLSCCFISQSVFIGLELDYFIAGRHFVLESILFNIDALIYQSNYALFSKICDFRRCHKGIV